MTKKNKKPKDTTLSLHPPFHVAPFGAVPFGALLLLFVFLSFCTPTNLANNSTLSNLPPSSSIGV